MSEIEEAPVAATEAEVIENIEEFIEPDKKRRKFDTEEKSDKLEHRLEGILCCVVCLDLPEAAVYQCINGHLMCAECFTLVLANARLRNNMSTCPNCRVKISKISVSRNRAVEKAVSELPSDCQYCHEEYPMNSLMRHEITCKESNSIKFPNDFQFGVATASYQIEGGWNENGKGENIWDHLTHNHPEMIRDHSNGDVACDSYHKIKEDVKLLVDLGVDFYRFSLSWSRILPSGFSNHINPDGIRYYRELIDELTANNIKPVVTLFHWDLPQPLQEIGGWTNPLLADYYEDYARVVFDNLAHNVKYWITFNEPYEVCEEALTLGNGAPVLFLKGIGDYLCAHTILKAHGRVYNLFKSKYKLLNDGQMGITLNTAWYEPKTNSTEDIAAADRKQKMTLDWFAHPIYSKDGDYPTVMKQRVAIMSSEENFTRSRLPTFTQEEIQMIKGSSDFFGLNHYTTSLVSDSPNNSYPSPSHEKDIGVNLTTDPNWPGSASNWLKVVPWGMSKLLHYINREYNNPDVFITENGFSDHGELNDYDRINYYKTYLEEVAKAISEGCNVRAYAAWSLLDNFEWMEGYTQRFGLYYVDFTNNDRPRVPKLSSFVYKDIIKNHEVNFTYWPSTENEPRVNYIN